MLMKREDYPIIDTLRAISILLVLLYHLNILKYGYTGVDIFFVISGFLLYKKLNNENITFPQYFENRALRIYPPFVLTIFTIFIFLLYLTPHDLLRKYMLEGLLGLNPLNLIHINHLTNSYFDPASDIFRHFWSLASEILLYILFYFIIYFSKKNIQRGDFYSFKILLFIIYLHFTTIIIFNNGYSIPNYHSYYFPVYRAIEFGLGVLIYKFNIVFKDINIRIKSIILLSILATVLLNPILFLFLTIFFLLYFKNYKYSVNRYTKYFASRSYVLYLLHLPIILLFMNKYVAIIFIFLLTEIIYFLSSRVRLTFLSIIFLLTVVYLYTLPAVSYGSDLSNCGEATLCKYQNGRFQSTSFKNLSLANDSILLIGDSHISDISGEIAASITKRESKATIYLYYHNGCLIGSESLSCKEYSKKSESLLKQTYKKVIFTQFNRDQENVDKSIVFFEKLSSPSKIYIGERPISTNTGVIFSDKLSFSELDLGIFTLQKYVASKSESKQIKYISLVKHLCDVNGCFTSVNGNSLFFNDNHFSKSGSKYIISKIEKEI